jgi:purine-nucleoside phosphorylase
VPRRLRPTAPIAARALLVGDPGRALLLAQELLEAPKMSNHSRGLWGYGGRAADGAALTIQSTGMGGPSAAIVLADLAELGVRAAIRVGTCVAIDPGLAPGDLLAVSEAEEKGAPAADKGAVALPNPELTAGLVRELAGGQAGDECKGAKIASLQAPLWVAPDISGKPTAEAFGGGVVAADMQTATVLARAAALGIAAAAVLVVEETSAGESIGDEPLAEAAKRAGGAAAAALSRFNARRPGPKKREG